MNHGASFGGYEAPRTGSEKKVSCVRDPPGNRTWCTCTVSAKRVRMSISRLMGCQLKKAADRKSTRLNSSHVRISYAVFCLKKKKKKYESKRINDPDVRDCRFDAAVKVC